MKQFYLLLFIFGTVASSVVYHGNRRQWTTVDSNGSTFVALHILNERVKVIFPSDKTFAEIANDIKLYSPAGNVKCPDTKSTMNFTLAFDGDKQYIRGKIEVDDKLLTMFMYEKCEGDERKNYYVTEIIENNYAELEGNGRRCFKDDDVVPFHLNGTNYVMELQPSPNGFGCQVFMILPEYMHIEDVKIPEYTKVKLNSTFAGHDETFWWKSDNDLMLPDSISFDSSKNVKINILNSTPTFPYFFRIGSEQFIPTFNFIFGEKCKETKFGIYLNLKPECQVFVKLGENGFEVSTKTTTSKIEFKGSLSSMIFGGKYVSIKALSPDSFLIIKSLEICDLSNPHDVSLDQFVLRIVPFQNASNECEKAEILLLNSDIDNHTEVLIDRSKIIQIKKSTTKSLKNTTISVATAIPPPITPVVESAEIEWWWFLIIGILIVGITVVIIVLIFYFRWRRQNQKKMPNSPSLESTEDEELGRITKEAKAAVLQERLSKEKKSKIVEKLEKTKEKLSLKKGATKNPPKVQQSTTNHQSTQQPKSIPAQKIQKSKHEPPRPSAEPSKPLQTPPIQTPPTLVLPKPRRNLKFRCREKTPMYGKDSDRTPSKSNNNKNESRTPKRTISADKSHFPDHYFETPLQPSSTLS